MTTVIPSDDSSTGAERRKGGGAPAPTRATYRHGDLRRALIETGLALAREGGPDAVVLREATRRTGVAPNAAYRHFDDRRDLFEAVRAAALGELARAIETRMAGVALRSPAADRARETLRAVGIGYLAFAEREPGLFRTAFATTELPVRRPEDPEPSAALGLNPYELLGAAIDTMVDAGALPAARRAGAEYLAWSAVHGMALLTIDGPIGRRPASERAALAERLVRMVERGL